MNNIKRVIWLCEYLWELVQYLYSLRKTVVEQYRRALARYGGYPYVDDAALFDCVRYGRWELASTLLTTVRARSARDALRIVRYTDPVGYFPLYFASVLAAPSHVVENICTVDGPRQATQKTSFGDTPLHIAFRAATEDVVGRLLVVAPEGVTIGNPDGWLPLHYAVLFRRSPSVMRTLLRLHPTSARAADRCGLTPLKFFVQVCTDRPDYQRFHNGVRLDHVIVGDGLSAFQEIFTLLLVSYLYGMVDDDAPTRTYRRDWLPLHEIIKLRILKRIFLTSLDQAMHLECVQHDEQRNFPLHLACEKMRF